MTTNSLYFTLWAEAVQLYANQQHLQQECLVRLVSISAALGNGLSTVIKRYFPDRTRRTLPEYNPPLSLNPWWISGYLTVYGSFSGNMVIRGRTNRSLTKYPRYRHQFSVKISWIDLPIRKLIADRLDISFYVSTIEKTVSLSAQSDRECQRLYWFLCDYPLQGPKAELVEAWGQYVIYTADLNWEVRYNNSLAFKPGARADDHCTVNQHIAVIDEIRRRLKEPVN